MEKTLGITRSNFNRLERLDFKDIIEECRNIFGVEVPGYHGTKVSVQAKVIVFRPSLQIPNLKCVEFIDNATNEIIEFFYDWGDSSNMLMKFHGHYHPDGTPEEIKRYDPFHLHLKIDRNDTELKKREKDTQYKCLYNVLIFIKQYVYVHTYAQK